MSLTATSRRRRRTAVLTAMVGVVVLELVHAKNTLRNANLRTTRRLAKPKPGDGFVYYEYGDDEAKQQKQQPGETNDYDARSAYGGSGGESTYGDGGYSPPTADDGWGSSSSSSSSSYGGSSGYSGDRTSSYGGDSSSYSSPYGGSSTSSDGFGSKAKNFWDSSKPITIPLLLAMFVSAVIMTLGMLYTAHQFQQFPEGMYANLCRRTLAAMYCIWAVAYNIYHCRLGEIPLPGDDDSEEYTEQELERMKLRPGIARALEVEHKKAMKKVELKRLPNSKTTS